RQKRLSRELLTALGAAARQHLAAPGCRHAGAEAVPALPYETARLIGPLGAHDWPLLEVVLWTAWALGLEKRRGPYPNGLEPVKRSAIQGPLGPTRKRPRTPGARPEPLSGPGANAPRPQRGGQCSVPKRRQGCAVRFTHGRRMTLTPPPIRRDGL